MSNGEPARAAVLQGTLDLMVLLTLGSPGPVHGYTIAGRLQQVSGGALRLNMATLYPALMRRRGLVRGSSGATDNNRKARFYALTSPGRRHLVKEKQECDRLAGITHAPWHGDA